MRTAIAGAVVCACALTGCSALSPETRAEETAYQVLSAVDASQTLSIADHPAQFREMNPAMGGHPRPANVAAYFAAGGATHFAMTYALSAANAPPWALRLWEVSGIGLEAVCVGNNFGSGIRPTLSFHINLDSPRPASSAPVIVRRK